MGIAGDLCVPRRRRCPCIAFSSLLDLTSQDPSANVMVFLGRDTSGHLRDAIHDPSNHKRAHHHITQQLQEIADAFFLSLFRDQRENCGNANG